MSKSHRAKRGRKGHLKRRVNGRTLRKRFLIICEGERTEPHYFEAFRVAKEVYDVVGEGNNTINLVRRAIKRKEKGNYDQVWVVMDKDDFPVQNFNNALSLARENGIQVAYSNEAFELWYLLHFDYHHTAMSRSSYRKRLTARLGFDYTKKDPNIYATLEERQVTAIKNATKLLGSYKNHHRPAYDNPVTTVHHLVEVLLEEAA